ncbi:hypothetical protein KKC56_00225 [Patescibacteria group bacterium]|nr:hypothetical protein [Patescibacteria group bacterium]
MKLSNGVNADSYADLRGYFMLKVSMFNNLFIISGPSGAGEDSIISILEKKLSIEKVITTTTRSMRHGEFQKKPYYFISKQKFLKNIKDNKFFEYALAYNNHYYGVTHNEINRVINSNKIGIWKIEYQGVISAKKLFKNIPAILINAPIKILEQRIKKRANVSKQYVQTRQKYTQEWMKYKKLYDYEVINQDGKLNQATDEVIKIILNYK